ncbi:MAG: GntR family transcriptional regulator [Oscillospiraceae bacterium]|nr:GntR family transcriptional regulator [Oscillospiraceae bacterium]
MKGKDLSVRIYEQMKRDLLHDRFPHDEMFNEQYFADLYGCSRTPAREAAGRLVYEGYLNKFPSKGYIIRVPGEGEVRELRECRYVLECGVIDKLIALATDEQIRGLGELPDGSEDDILYLNNLSFHRDMARMAGNSKIADLIEHLLCLLVRPLVASRYPSFDAYAAQIRENGNPLTAEHRAILDAMLARDVEAARAALRRDIFPAKDL